MLETVTHMMKNELFLKYFNNWNISVFCFFSLKYFHKSIVCAIAVQFLSAQNILTPFRIRLPVTFSDHYGRVSLLILQQYIMFFSFQNFIVSCVIISLSIRLKTSIL